MFGQSKLDIHPSTNDDKIIPQMPRSSSPSTDDKTDYALELHNFLAALSQNAERESVASEIEGKRSSHWMPLLRYNSI